MKIKSQTKQISEPFLSDKTPSDEKIALTEKNKIIKTDTKTVNVLILSFLPSLVISIFLLPSMISMIMS